MKYYLSSYKFGNEVEKLKTMLPAGSRIGHINNDLDFPDADPVRTDAEVAIIDKE